MPDMPKTGKVIRRDDKFYLVTPGKEEQFQIAASIDSAQLNELVGKEVELVYSEPRVFVTGIVGVGTVRPPRIICYFPIDTDLGVIAEDARTAFAQQFLDEGILSKENYERLTGE